MRTEYSAATARTVLLLAPSAERSATREFRAGSCREGAPAGQTIAADRALGRLRSWETAAWFALAVSAAAVLVLCL